MLRGWKTYIVAAVLVLAAGLRHYGWISQELFTSLEGLLLGAGLAALRAGIAKGH